MSEHIVSPKIYLVIFLTLMVGTAVTVWAAFQNFGQFNIVIALAIATFKATLVVLYFMHEARRDLVPAEREIEIHQVKRPRAGRHTVGQPDCDEQNARDEEYPQYRKDRGRKVRECRKPEQSMLNGRRHEEEERRRHQRHHPSHVLGDGDRRRLREARPWLAQRAEAPYGDLAARRIRRGRRQPPRGALRAR